MRRPVVQPSRKRFAEIVHKALRDAGIHKSVSYDPSGFRLVLEGALSSIFLSDAYQVYCAAPVRCRSAALQPLVTAALQVQSCKNISAAEGMPRLLPFLRKRTFYGDLGQLPIVREPVEPTFPHRLVADHLAVGLVCGFPDYFVYVDDTVLSHWEMPEEQAFAAAFENLRKRSNAFFTSCAPGVFVSPWNDTYDASRLALVEVIRQCKVKGDYVAAAPNRNTLIVTGSEDVEGMKCFFDVVESTLKQPLHLTGLPVRFCGRWVTLELVPDHPQFNRLRKVRLQSEADDYTFQREQIYRLRAENARCFPARVMLPKDPRTAELFSICTWSDKEPLLLPRTERIVFTRTVSDSQVQFAAACGWDRAISIVGNLMTPLGMYPERFRVEHFPSQDQLNALGVEDWWLICRRFRQAQNMGVHG